MPGRAPAPGRDDPPTVPLVRVDLGVPMYMHPLADPVLWLRLARAAAHVRFAVVNVHDGPGTELDLAYADAIHQLDAARVRTIGYVDTAYAARPVDDCVADAVTWVGRYGVRGVFLDQVSSRFEDLEHYAEVILGARSAGAQFVVLNPGTDCHPGYADLANVVVVFEGPWRDYTGWTPPGWCLSLPAARFCHLVHEVPWHLIPDGPAAAASRHAATAFFTDGHGTNSWDQLPMSLVEAVETSHRGAVPVPALTALTWQPRRYVAADTAAADRHTGRRARLKALLGLARPAPHLTHRTTSPQQGDPR